MKIRSAILHAKAFVSIALLAVASCDSCSHTEITVAPYRLEPSKLLDYEHDSDVLTTLEAARISAFARYYVRSEMLSEEQFFERIQLPPRDYTFRHGALVLPIDTGKPLKHSLYGTADELGNALKKLKEAHPAP